MSSVQYLREFIKERLTAVCEEIFSEVQKTIVQYEEEINHQYRLDISRKPDRNSHITDLPQHHGCKEEEVLDEEQVCNQERNSSLNQEDPEPPQIKEEQEEICSSQEGEQHGLKQKTEDIIIWTDEEQLRWIKTIWKPEIKLHRIDLQQQNVRKEEVVTIDQQVCNQERNSSLDQEGPEPPQIKEEQEDPEPPQIKEEQEELCSSQEGEQLGLKQEADTLMETPTYEESAYSEPEPHGEQFLSEAESRDHDESQHVDSGSAGNSELKKNRCHRKRSQSQREDSPPVSVSRNRTNTKNKSVQCNLCGRILKNNKMTRHLRIHTGERPYSCKICGKTFIQAGHLVTHVKIHTGEKPYLCSICGKTFKEKWELRRHVRSHTGEKPYSCSSCGIRFGRLDRFKMHMKIHTV